MSPGAKTKATKLDAARYRALRMLTADPEEFDRQMDEVLARQKATKPKPKSEHPLYGRWRTMIARCKDKRPEIWKDYGGRGITVCERWLNSFDAFVEDMGLPPSPLHTIDRKNSSGNYEPSNCRWATDVEQNRNRRSPHHAKIGVPGLSPSKGRIRVSIKVGDKLRHVGMADSVEEGTRMRKEAEALHWR